jgi:hypothetical protein
MLSHVRPRCAAILMQVATSFVTLSTISGLTAPLGHHGGLPGHAVDLHVIDAVGLGGEGGQPVGDPALMDREGRLWEQLGRQWQGRVRCPALQQCGVAPEELLVRSTQLLQAEVDGHHLGTGAAVDPPGPRHGSCGDRAEVPVAIRQGGPLHLGAVVLDLVIQLGHRFPHGPEPGGVGLGQGLDPGAAALHEQGLGSRTDAFTAVFELLEMLSGWCCHRRWPFAMLNGQTRCSARELTPAAPGVPPGLDLHLVLGSASEVSATPPALRRPWTQWS